MADRDDPARGRMDAAERASFKLQELTGCLQLYARRIEPALQRTLVESLIGEALDQVSIDADQTLEPGLVVEIDPMLLTRAIQELFENALPARWERLPPSTSKPSSSRLPSTT